MKLLKKHINPKASSLLESVVSLSLISICIYVSILVYSLAFNEKITLQSHLNTLESYKIFYESSINEDLDTDSIPKSLNYEEEWLSTDFKLIRIRYNDSVGNHHSRKYYVNE